MILTGVEVSGCGRFRERTRLVGLGEGVNVLAADNEAGKSTLFRAVRTCLFERHSAKGRLIEALGTQGADLPLRIAVSFRRNGRDYRIEKSFLRGVRALLTENGRDLARDRAADDALWDILGLSSGGRGGLDDAGRFGLLWVGQTKSFAFEAPSPGTAEDLARLIAAEVGELVGGERARAVLAKVRAALAEVTTETGKPRAGGAWRGALDHRDALIQRRDALARQAEILDEDMRALDAVRAELARNADPARRRALAEELNEARAAEARGRSAADRLQRREIEARAATAARSESEARLRRLEEDCRGVDETRAGLAALDLDLARLDTAAAQARAALSSAMRGAEESEARAAATQREEASLNRLAQACEAQERIAEWRPRLEEARAWTARVEAFGARAAALAMDPQALARLEALAERIQRLRAKREAGAPRLTVTLGSDRSRPITLDGVTVSADVDRPVLGPLTLSIGDAATITVAPAHADESDRQALLSAERDMDAGFAELGVAHLGEARARQAEAAEVQRERQDLRDRLTGLAKSLKAQDGIEALAERIAAAQGRIARALAEEGLTTLPDHAALEARRAELLERLPRLEVERRRVQAALEAARETDRSASTAATTARARRADMAAALEAALARVPDATREEDLVRVTGEASQAREHETAALAAVEAQRREAPSADGLVDLANRVLRLEQAIENHDLRRQDMEKRLATLEEAVSRAGGLGLGEEVEIVEAELALAERDLTRREEEVASLRLLRATIEDTLAESRERYLAPVKRQVRPYLHALFPGADLALADDLTPSGLGRGGSLEAHDLLSDGTREQIAILVRLALAELLAEGGEPVPIILDDALVYSDDTRIAGMFDALSRAAKSQQVIVFTCRNRAFEALGGRVLTLDTIREDVTSGASPR